MHVFSPHNFLGMTRESLSPSSGPREEARNAAGLGKPLQQQPDDSRSGSQDRKCGRVLCCRATKGSKQQTSEGRAGYRQQAQALRVPQRLGPARSKEKSASKKSTMTQRKLETVNGESPLNHSLNGRAGPSCNRPLSSPRFTDKGTGSRKVN